MEPLLVEERTILLVSDHQEGGSNVSGATLGNVFGILKHPIRRKIVLILSKGPKRYSEMIAEVGLYTGHFYYHLNAVKSLTKKNEDGYYELNELGLKAAELVREVAQSEKQVAEKTTAASSKQAFAY